MSNTFEAIVLETIRYFSFFKFAPDFGEIYTFLKKKSSKKDLESILENMEEKKVLIRSKNGDLYTTPQYTLYFRDRLIRQQISQNKLRKIQLFLKILSWFPQIELIGLSGTVAMMNAQEKDDIDLFIISEKRRLWTARIISLIVAQVSGLRRKAGESEAKDKICLNLFFDESNLQIPKYKQTEYVAHEVLQMKPVTNKNFTYEKFLDKNKWVYTFFPNAKKPIVQKIANNNPNFIGNVLEFILKKLQLTIIKLHQTSEIVTDTQLWFFPDDFERKIKSKML